jgi:nucleoside-diphosphate kinase
MERTLVLIKPDAVQRGLVGEIIARLERRGLKLVSLKLVDVSQDLAREHYAVHKGKPFYEPLIEYITRSPVVALVLEGPSAISITRRTMGATAPADAAAGTIRGDYGLEIGRNLVHGSDGPETARTEIDLWFAADELISWDRATDEWVYE